MGRKILQVNYAARAARPEFERENLPYAEPIAATPGLQWKIWLLDEERDEAGGIYLFDDEDTLRDFLEGPIIAEMRDDPTLEIKVFDVLVDHTTVTRGPIG